MVSSTFPALADIRLQLTCGLYGLVALLAFVCKYVPETKGRQLESMDDFLTTAPASQR